MPRHPDCSLPNCRCIGKPDIKFATPGYAANRYHVDAGDLAALKQMNEWLEAAVPFTHIRYADGEFNSMLGVKWTNADGQETEPETLGRELFHILDHAKRTRTLHSATNVGELLFGGDWTGPPERYQFLVDRGLLDLPWCPSQVFVNGLPHDETLRMLKIIADRSRRRKNQVFVVANKGVCDAVAPALRATAVVVPNANAWSTSEATYKSYADKLREGDVVVLACGMTANVLAYAGRMDRRSTTQIDVGCVFDEAAGVLSRGWQRHDDDPRLQAMRREVIPWLKNPV